MKIAVYLYGHLRDFEKCSESLRTQILDKYDADLFMHTWDETEVKTFSPHSQRTRLRKIDRPIVEEHYPVTKLILEHQEKFEDTKIVSPFDGKYTFSNAATHFIFYALNKINETRKQYEQENNIKYDLIIVTRPDVLFMKEFSLMDYLFQAEVMGLDKYKCRFFASRNHQSSLHPKLSLNQPNDLLYFGSPEVIESYIKCNLDLDIEYIKKHCINLVTVYSAKEIEAGILPVAIGYTMDIDWSFSGSRVKATKYIIKQTSMLKKSIIMGLRLIFRPLFRFYYSHKWINYYE